MAKRRKVNNLLGLGVLALLVPGRGMHPYEMANVLRNTGKERDLRIKWGSFYTVVANLEKAGFIVATGSDREGGRPERTVYEITDAGRAEVKDWLRELVGVPEPDESRFEAALSVIGVLGPDEVTDLLRQRVAALDQDIGHLRQGVEMAHQQGVSRLFLIEAEYALAMRAAELAWVRSLLTEMEEGTLPGIDDWRTYAETGEMPADVQKLFMESGLDPH